MCWGKNPSARDARKVSLSDSLEKVKGTNSHSHHSNGSNTKSTAKKSGIASSPQSKTGATTQTGGASMMDTGPGRKTNDSLPTEKTAKSPTKKGSAESAVAVSKSRQRKSSGIGVDTNVDTYRSTKDEVTLRNLKESMREGPAGPETSDADNSEWSIMGKGPRKKAAASRRAQPKAPRPALRPPAPPVPPSIPTPPVPTIPSLPTPSVTTPVPPPLLPVRSEEKTALNQTVCTQRTMVEDETKTISRHQTFTHRKKQRDVSYEVETKRFPVSTPPPEDLRLRQEEPTAMPVAEPSVRPAQQFDKSTTIDVTKSPMSPTS